MKKYEPLLICLAAYVWGFLNGAISQWWATLLTMLVMFFVGWRAADWQPRVTIPRDLENARWWAKNNQRYGEEVTAVLDQVCEVYGLDAHNWPRLREQLAERRATSSTRGVKTDV